MGRSRCSTIPCSTRRPAALTSCATRSGYSDSAQATNDPISSPPRLRAVPPRRPAELPLVGCGPDRPSLPAGPRARRHGEHRAFCGPPEAGLRQRRLQLSGAAAARLGPLDARPQHVVHRRREHQRLLGELPRGPKGEDPRAGMDGAGGSAAGQVPPRRLLPPAGIPSARTGRDTPLGLKPGGFSGLLPSYRAPPWPVSRHLRITRKFCGIRCLISAGAGSLPTSPSRKRERILICPTMSRWA